MQFHPYRIISLTLVKLPLVLCFALGESAFALEEVVVTAQKRDESMQDVPVSISAFSEDFIRQAGVDDVDDIISFTPGLTGSSTGTVANWGVRGITSSDFTIGSEPSVATYIDDGYIGRNVLASSAFFDIERIEVVRGPQGTLFGRNAAAGAISVHTNKPNNENSLDIALGGGNEDQRLGELIGNLAVSETLFIRAGFFKRERNTGQTERNSGEDRFDDSEGYRISALWEPTETLSARLTHQRVDFDTRFGLVHPADIVDADPHAETIGHDFPHLDKSDTHGTSLHLSWDVSENLTLSSITDLRRYDFRFSQDIDGVDFGLLSQADLFLSVDPAPVFGVGYLAEQDQESYSQEFRLNGSSESIDWFAGVIWFKEDVRESQALGYNLAGTATIPGFLLDSDDTIGEFTSLAIFGDVAWHATESLKLAVGARWTKDDKDWCATSVGFTFNDTAGQEICGSDSWNDFSPRFAADWRLADDILLYLSVSRGYKAGGASATPENTSGAINPINFAPLGEVINFVDPEEVQAYEVGVKSTLFSDSLRLNVAVYHNEIDNLQILDVVNLVSVLRNANEAEINGIELDLTYSPSLEGLKLHANFALMDSEFKDALVNGVSLSGNALKLAPEKTAAVSLAYDVVLNTGTLTFFGAYNWQDEQFWDIQNTVIQGSYGLWSGQIRYKDRSEKWQIALTAKNLSDREYSNAIINYGTGLGDEFVKGLPRMVNLEFRYAFN